MTPHTITSSLPVPPLLNGARVRSDWLDHCREQKSNHQFRYDYPGHDIYAPKLLNQLSHTFGRPFITCDVGQHQMWVAQHCKFDSPERTVVVVTGDGSFMMNVQELATLSDNPDFSLVARSFGLDALTIDKAEEIEQGLQFLQDSTGPCLLHVRIDPGANVWSLMRVNAQDLKLDVDCGERSPDVLLRQLNRLHEVLTAHYHCNPGVMTGQQRSLANG